MSKIYGTWLGDDVLLVILGVIVPGQEVLRISAAPDGRIMIEQFWYKSVVPEQSEDLMWGEDGTYQGRVMTGVFERGSTEGQWHGPQFMDETYTFYHDITFDYGRAEQLFVMTRLNHFELPVRFRHSGDVLVLDTQGFVMPDRFAQARTVTYSRVDDHAPDLAMQIVRSMLISATEHFDCLTHQISAREGPFFDAMAPYTFDDIETAITQKHATEISMMAQMDAMRALDDVPDDVRDRLMATMEQKLVLSSSPVILKLDEVLGTQRTSGCVNLR